MSESCLTVSQLLKEDYIIPLYQRNFAWTYDEIERLIVDVADACKEKKDAYYIGTLVVDTEKEIIDGQQCTTVATDKENTSKRKNIIDGQQRTTALTLIALALKKYDSIHLKFKARQASDDTLKKLLEYVRNSDEEVKEVRDASLNELTIDELTIGFDNAVRALKKVLGEKNLEREEFTAYMTDE